MVWVLPEAKSEPFKCKSLLGEDISRNLGRELVKWHREEGAASKEFIITPITHLEIQSSPTSGQESLGVYPGTPSTLRAAASLALPACLPAVWLMYPAASKGPSATEAQLCRTEAVKSVVPNPAASASPEDLWKKQIIPLLPSLPDHHATLCFPLLVGPHCSAAEVSSRANFLLFL